jgi:hypothetical protein
VGPPFRVQPGHVQGSKLQEALHKAVDLKEVQGAGQGLSHLPEKGFLLEGEGPLPFAVVHSEKAPEPPLHPDGDHQEALDLLGL